MTEKELVTELRSSLPTQRILREVRAAGVMVNGEVIFLKHRGRVEDENVLDLEDYNEVKGTNHDYSELQGKRILIDLKLFGNRGAEVIDKYSKVK